MTRLLGPPAHVKVPATSANLGPGFDALGLAMNLHDEVTVQVSGTRVRVAVTGEGAGELPDDESHLVARCALATLDRLGVHLDGLVVTCRNSIPQARGLGSSSAAIVAGILAARALVVGGADKLADEAVLELAAEIEGHPDNVAPCLLGGCTIAWLEGGRARAVRAEPAEGVQPVIFIPATRGLTAHARAALPARVPHRDAARTAGRAALLVHALTTAPDLLFPATEDWLHQGYRAPGAPATYELVTTLRAAGIPAVVSGAGPSVLAFAGFGEIPITPGWHRIDPGIDMRGAMVQVGWPR
jgi:homoserine kinase